MRCTRFNMKLVWEVGDYMHTPNSSECTVTALNGLLWIYLSDAQRQDIPDKV